MTTGRVMVCRLLMTVLTCITISIIHCEPAHASDQDRAADVACVVVGLRMAQASTPEQRDAGIILAAYYLGRLDEQLRDAESERLIESEAGNMSSAEFRANAVRCGNALASKGQEIQKIGAKLARKEASEK